MSFVPRSFALRDGYDGDSGCVYLKTLKKNRTMTNCLNEAGTPKYSGKGGEGQALPCSTRSRLPGRAAALRFLHVAPKRSCVFGAVHGAGVSWKVQAGFSSKDKGVTRAGGPAWILGC